VSIVFKWLLLDTQGDRSVWKKSEIFAFCGAYFTCPPPVVDV